MWNMTSYDINYGLAEKEIHQSFWGLKHLPNKLFADIALAALLHIFIKRQRRAFGGGSGGRLTCSGAACWTVWAGKPLVSGSSRCWSSCRCDFAAPARSACSSAAPPSASSAPAPAWKTTESYSHLHMPNFKLHWSEGDSGVLGHLLSVVILSCCGTLVCYVPVGADCFRAGSLFLLGPPCGWRRSVCAASARFWRRAFSRPRRFASLLVLR